MKAMINKVMKSYPLQVFRHRVYLPWLSMLGHIGDIKRNIITEKIDLNDIEIDFLADNRDEATGYSLAQSVQTSRYSTLKTTLTFSKNLGFDKFLDIGCGLGRSLVVANELGFVDLHGVDITDILISKCRKNMIKVGIFPSLICSDVDNFEIPAGKLVIYLFNPFGEERMRDLVKKLVLREQETLVIYHNPKHFECFKNLSKINTHVWNHFGLYQEKAFIYLIPAKLKN